MVPVNAVDVDVDAIGVDAVDVDTVHVDAVDVDFVDVDAVDVVTQPEFLPQCTSGQLRCITSNVHG